MGNWKRKGRRVWRELRLIDLVTEMEVWMDYGFKDPGLLCGTGCELLLIMRVIGTESRNGDDAEQTVTV